MRLRKSIKIDLLKKVPLFAGCSKRDLGLIASIADEIRQPEGTDLIVEGRKGREFFVLVDGNVEIRQRKRRLGTAGAGDFFGEIALILDAPRSASVTALTPVRLLVIERLAFQRLMRDVPSIQTRVLEALAARLAPESY